MALIESIFTNTALDADRISGIVDFVDKAMPDALATTRENVSSSLIKLAAESTYKIEWWQFLICLSRISAVIIAEHKLLVSSGYSHSTLKPIFAAANINAL